MVLLWADLGWPPHAHQASLSLLVLKRTERRNWDKKWEGSWSSLTWANGQKRFDSIYFNCFLVTENKTKTTNPLSAHFFPGSNFFLTSLSPHFAYLRDLEKVGWSQFIKLHFCWSYLFTLVPCHSVGSLRRDTVLFPHSFPWAAVLQEMLHCGLHLCDRV